MELEKIPDRKNLTQENSSKEKTKHITSDNLNMSKYLWEKENRGLSQTILVSDPKPLISKRCNHENT